LLAGINDLLAGFFLCRITDNSTTGKASMTRGRHGRDVGKDTRRLLLAFCRGRMQTTMYPRQLHSERFIFAAYEVPRNIFASKVYGGLLLQA
jgi:hypothetical protein